ncbi:MAG: TlpA family protein disulfide reductase [Armatimonadetes bacterium]|nr:TlpA family protein disulfide reductase [Armatimonadota bacterium]
MRRFEPLIAVTFIIAMLAIAHAESQNSEKKPPALKIGAPAPDFKLNDQNGKSWKLSDQKKKTVIISFGFISCICGRAALKEIQGLQEKYASRGLCIVHVNTEPWMCEADPSYLSTFARENKITFPLLIDKELSVSSLYPSESMPFLCLVDAKGILRFTLAGHPEDYVKKVTEQVEKFLPQVQKNKKSDNQKPSQDSKTKS